MKPTPLSRQQFPHFHRLNTRWMDNDVYGHVNNVVYYSWFDTAVNQFLIERGSLDIEHSPTIGLVIETHCNYFASIAFPQQIDVGVAVAHLGRSSVRYELGIFASEQQLASAQGHFVHVYVDRGTRKPVAIPDTMRSVLQTILRPST